MHDDDVRADSDDVQEQEFTDGFFYPYIPEAAQRTMRGCKSVPPEIRFTEQIRFTARCWEWTGMMSRRTPMFQLSTTPRKRIGARQYAYEQEYGPLRYKARFLPGCGNDRCISPDCTLVVPLQPIQLKLPLRRSTAA